MAARNGTLAPRKMTRAGDGPQLYHVGWACSGFVRPAGNCYGRNLLTQVRYSPGDSDRGGLGVGRFVGLRADSFQLSPEAQPRETLPLPSRSDHLERKPAIQKG